MTFRQRVYVGLAVGAVVLLGALLLALNPFVIIGAGQRGVVLNWGAFQGGVYEPGLHWRTPIVQQVVKVNVQTQKIEIEKSSAYSKDLQVVDIHSVVNYNVDPKEVGYVYQQYGLGFEGRILVPALEAAIKQTIAQYSAEELLAKRGEVQSAIEATYRQSIPKEFVVSKYALTNEDFSDDYEKAIERKQVAQQDAERAENELKKTKIEAEQRVAQAQAEAEAIRIQAQAITQQGGKDYVQLKAIEKWDGKLPQQFVPGSTIPFLDLK